MTRYIDADALVKSLQNVGANLQSALIGVVANAPTVVSITPPVSIPPNGALPGYRISKDTVFNAPYSDASNWTNGKTSAYPNSIPGTTQVNPGDSKLDIIGTGFSRPTDAGVFTATPSSAGGGWKTQLVTTEGSAKGFAVRTGDVVAFDLTVSSLAGSWPALWTWAGPANEVDFFEYHGDNPTTLEFTNHVKGGVPDYPKIVTPGKLCHIEVVLGATSVVWWVDGVQVFSDGVGVGSKWSAYLIANLSVQAGNQYHPGPAASTTKIQATIANVTVYR